MLLGLLALACSPLELPDYTRVPLLDPAGVLQVYPWVFFNADQLARGHFPLWNHLTGLGQPHLANIQTALFYPLYWAWYAISGEPAYGALMVFRLWLAGLLWFVFARRRTASFAGALVTGAAYGMGGYALWFSQLIDLNSQLLLPAVMLAWSSLWSRPRLPALLGSAALTALVIFGGHPEAAFITIFVGLAYTATMGAALECAGSTALCSAGGLTHASPEKTPRQAAAEKSAVKPAHSKWRGPAAVVASLALGGLLSLGVTIPFLDYLSRCWTMHGSGFGFIHLDPRGFFNLIVPGVHHLFKGMPTELPVEMTTAGMWDAFSASYRATAAPGNLPGAGLVVCGLAVVAMTRPRRLNRHALFFIGLLAFTLGLTFGLPLFRLIAFIPPFNLNSNFKFFFSEIHAALAVLAGVGFDRVFASRAGSKYGMKLMVGVAALVVISYTIWSVIFVYPKPSEAVPYMLVTFYIFFAVLVLLQITGFSSWNYRPSVVLMIFIFLSAATDEVKPFIVLEPRAWGERPVEQAVKKLLPSEQRMLGIDGFFPANSASVYGIKDIRSSDALFYRPYINLLNRVNRLTPEQSLSYFYPSYFTQVMAERIENPEAAQLGISLIIGQEKYYPASIAERSIIDGRSIYGVSPPKRKLGHPGYVRTSDESQSLPGVLLHAPAMFEYTPEEKGQGELGFSIDSSDGDGVFFAVTSLGEPSQLLYARFLKHPIWNQSGGEPDIDARVKLVSGFRLITLPGPRDNWDRDQSSFLALSWHTENFVPPSKPDWSYDWYYYAYKVPSLPWSHLDGDTAELSVTRTAGDEVAVEVPAGEGGGASGEAVGGVEGTAGGRTLVVHEVWYPGWTAEVDGKPVAIEYPADKVSWRVPLPAGARRVVFRFVPWDFRVGLDGMLATALVCLIAILWSRFFPVKGERR